MVCVDCSKTQPWLNPNCSLFIIPLIIFVSWTVNAAACSCMVFKMAFAIILCNQFLLWTSWEWLTRAWECNTGGGIQPGILSLIVTVTRSQNSHSFSKPFHCWKSGSWRIIHFLENQLMKGIILIGGRITLSCFVGIYVLKRYELSYKVSRNPERYVNTNLHGWYDNRDVLFR